MKIVKNIFLVVISLVFTYLLSYPIGKFYIIFFPDGGGSFINGTSLVGMPLAYILFITFLFTAFGGTKKYWWIGIGLIPAILFEVAFDLRHLYFPVAIGLVAWLVGRGVSLLVEKK